MITYYCYDLYGNPCDVFHAIVISKYSAIDTFFEPDIGGIRLEQFVACTPGFGIREIFCAACQVHYFSPDQSAECVACPTGFHQPIAGSDKCVKCPNVFASGCEVIVSTHTIITEYETRVHPSRNYCRRDKLIANHLMNS